MSALAEYTGGWDQAAVYELAQHAAGAYPDSGFDCGTLIENEHTDTQCYLKDYGTHAVLTFRGTEPPDLMGFLNAEGPWYKRLWKQMKDLWTDAMVSLKPWLRGGEVHHGFVAAFRSVEQEISLALRQVPGASPLFITGHSLGGALATLAASRFDCKMVCTFGSPRVGDRKFARAFTLRNAGRYFRVFNKSDIVARVPTPIRYAHCGLPIFITYQGKIWPRPGYWVRLKTFSRNILHGRKSSLLANHGMDQYLEALEP